MIGNGTNNTNIAAFTIRGAMPGKSDLLITVSSMDDDRGIMVNPNIIISTVEVSAIKALSGQTEIPTDPDNDGLFEDMNGNRRTDFNDVVLFFNYIEWIQENEPIVSFDFNRNGWIDFNDLIMLFGEL